MKRFLAVIAGSVLLMGAKSGQFVSVYGGSGQPGYTAGGTCASSGYLHYRVITVAAQSGLSGNLSNYPLVVSGTYSYLATVANGGLVQNSSGYDVGFFTDNTCSTKLAWETETWTAASGLVNYWVKVPTISKTSSITFVMAYDNTTITTDQSNKTGTWDANFYAVYHFPNGSTLTANDSTTNANNATISGAVAATGKVDGAVVFDSTNFVSKPSVTGSPTGNHAISESGWINSTNLSGNRVAIFSNTDGNGTAYGLYTAGTNLRSEFGSGAGGISGSTTLATSTWYYVAATYTGTSNLVYVNGVLDGSVSYSSANLGAASIFMGEWGNASSRFVGTLDEARYSNIARSADWLKTDYNSQSSPSTFYSVGSQF